MLWTYFMVLWYHSKCRVGPSEVELGSCWFVISASVRAWMMCVVCCFHARVDELLSRQVRQWRWQKVKSDVIQHRQEGLNSLAVRVRCALPIRVLPFLLFSFLNKMLALLMLPQQTRRLCFPSQTQNPARLTKLAVSAHWSRIIVFFFGVNALVSDSSVGHRVECARNAATWSRFGLELDWIICPDPLTGSGERLSCRGLFLCLWLEAMSLRGYFVAFSKCALLLCLRILLLVPAGLPVRSQGDPQSDNRVMDNITVRQGETVFLRWVRTLLFFPDARCSLSAASLKLRAAEMTPSAWGRSRNITEVLSAPPPPPVTANGVESGGGFQGIRLENTQSRSDTLLICSSC